MEKEFIPYEHTLALKELGFNEPCIKEYHLKQLLNNSIGDEARNSELVELYNEPDVIAAPTFSQAFRWFREKKYQAEILWRGDFGDFCWKIGRFKYGSHFFSEDGFDTYEEAELECLKKLIEIVKTKETC